MRQDFQMSRGVRSRGLLEASRAELPLANVDTEHVWHPSPVSLRSPTYGDYKMTPSIM